MNSRNDRFLTRYEVEARCRLGRSTIYRLMRAGQFPEPFQIGPRAVRWSAGEIETWLRERPRATGERSRQSHSRAKEK